MPRGPKGERRPANVIGNAILVAKIATGEEQDTPQSPTRIERARKGAAGRATKLSDEQRADIARVAAQARWKKSGA